jgi:outer membrane protein assembly factor BamB
MLRTARRLSRSNLAIPMILCGLQSAALAQPTVSASPKSGPPTFSVAVSGAGFANEEAVDVYFDTSDLALAVTNSGGSFSGVPLTIPTSAAPGTHWITGVGQRSGLAAQSSFLVRTDWPQFLAGPQHHGYNPTENVLNVSNVAGLQLLWRTPTLGNNSSPVLDSGILFVESQCRYLYALDAATGQPLWVVPTGDSKNHFNPTPAVAQGIVYTGSNDGLYAFEAATGKQIWSALPGSSVESVTVANGLVYAGELNAFDAATGQSVWSVTGISTIFSAPAVANGVAYVGSDDGSVYAFDAATGRQIWQSADTEGSIFGSATVANGIVLVQSYRNFFAFNAVTGETLWSQNILNDISASPAVANGIVYEGYYALNPVTGKVLWNAPLGDVWSSAALANGVVYLGDQNFNMYALNAASGEILWTAATDGDIESEPVVANGIVYVTSLDSVYAFGLPAPDAPAQPDPATLKPDLSLRRLW